MLRGEKIYLANYVDGDAGYLADWQWDTEFVNGLSEDVAHPYQPSDWQVLFDEASNSDSEIMFTIRDIETCMLIGFVSLSDIYLRSQRAEVGIGIPQAKDRNQGYGQEALALILDYAFNHLNLHKLTLSVHSFNMPAIRAYEKAGFVREGVNREAVPKDGIWYDQYNYGLLNREWRAMKKG